MTQRVIPRRNGLVAGRMYSSAGTNITASATWSRRTYDTTNYDTAGVINTTNNRIEIEHSGFWRIRAGAQFDTNTTGNRRGIRLKVNETYTGQVPDGVGTILATYIAHNLANNVAGLAVQWAGWLDAGDYVHTEVWQNSGAALTTSGGSSLECCDAIFLGTGLP